MPMPFNPREILAAAPDAITLASGGKLDRPHPLAGELSLRKIAYACGLNKQRQFDHEPDVAVMGRGLATSDFSKILADGVVGLAIATYNAQAEHIAFSVPVDVRDFKPASIPALDADLSLEPLGDGAEIKHGGAFLVAGAQRQVLLTSFARIVEISRAAIVSDALSGFAQLIGSIGASAARVEARLVVDALESNSVLDDGAVTFRSDYSNVVEDALDATTLGQAMALLRIQNTAAGQRADLRARHLVTAPDIEYSARKLIADAAMGVVVSTMANLPAGRWYLLADPVACPVVGNLRLGGSKYPLLVEQWVAPFHSDNAGVLVRADLGACIMRRTGIVRGGA